MEIKQYTIKVCDECKSEFYKEISSMENLCPECSHVLYGYKNCQHDFIDQRCVKCYWNGNSSDYIDTIKKPNIS